MSRTHRDKLKAQGKGNRHKDSKACRVWWKNLSFKDEMKAFPGYNHNPSWWNHLFSVIKARRMTKKQLIKILKNPELADNIVFHGYKKPTQYYW